MFHVYVCAAVLLAFSKELQVDGMATRMAGFREWHGDTHPRAAPRSCSSCQAATRCRCTAARLRLPRRNCAADGQRRLMGALECSGGRAAQAGYPHAVLPLLLRGPPAQMNPTAQPVVRRPQAQPVVLSRLCMIHRPSR